MTVADFPIIRIDRLLLRQFVDSDIENVYKGLSDPEIIKYYGVSYKTLEDTVIFPFLVTLKSRDFI